MRIINALLLHASSAMAYVAHCLKMSALAYLSPFTADLSSVTNGDFGRIGSLH